MLYIWWHVLEWDSTELILGNLFLRDNQSAASRKANLNVTFLRGKMSLEWHRAGQAVSPHPRGAAYFLTMGNSVCCKCVVGQGGKLSSALRE